MLYKIKNIKFSWEHGLGIFIESATWLERSSASYLAWSIFNERYLQVRKTLSKIHPPSHMQLCKNS